MQTEPGDNITAMEIEFKKLSAMQFDSEKFFSANLPCNKFKNRLVNILPYESSRVCLQPIRGETFIRNQPSEPKVPFFLFQQ